MVFGIGLIFSQLFSTFPLYIHSVFGFAENRIGQLLAINTVMIVVFEMVLLHSLKNIRPLKVIGAGALLTGLGFALTPLGRGFFYAALTVAVWTMGEMLSLPLLTAEISDRSNDHNRGRHMGLFGVSFSLAFMIGPTGWCQNLRATFPASTVVRLRRAGDYSGLGFFNAGTLESLPRI